MSLIDSSSGSSYVLSPIVHTDVGATTSDCDHTSDFTDWHGMPPDEDTLVNMPSDVDLLNASNEHFVQKSTRDRKPPAWWTDYQVNSVHQSTIKYPISGFVSTAGFSV